MFWTNSGLMEVIIRIALTHQVSVHRPVRFLTYLSPYFAVILAMFWDDLWYLLIRLYMCSIRQKCNDLVIQKSIRQSQGQATFTEQMQQYIVKLLITVVKYL